MISRIVTATRAGVCECGCDKTFKSRARIVVLGPPAYPILFVRLECADELRISLGDQFGREKRRKP